MIIQSIIIWVLQIFLIALFGRVIFDYVRMFSPSFRPRGIVLVVAEFVYGVTDPVMRFVRRFIPPLRLGPVAIDLSFIAVFIVVQTLISLAQRIH
jgi:YggT family protein